ncbi:MAG: GNAT family N-acetyltransferase [Bacillota bacterium]
MEQFVYANEGRVLLREANRDDIPKINDLFAELAKNDYWQNEELTRLRYDAIDQANGFICVAVLNEEVIGYTEVVLPAVKDEFAFVTKLQIDEEFKRRKFGTELIRYAMILTKQQDYVGAVVWPDVDKSKGLYKKVGFKEIKDNQKVKFEVCESNREFTGEVEQEFSSVEELDDYKMVIGCPYTVDFTWFESKQLATEGLLDYSQPSVQEVVVAEGRGVIFFDNRHIFIALPPDEEDNLELITSLLQYGTQLANQEGAGELLTYIDEDIWSEIEIEFEELWEIKEQEPRLEMKMEFE